MRKRFANLLRTIAVIQVNVAEHIDPQPPITGIWPFEVHTATGTNSCHAEITWVQD